MPTRSSVREGLPKNVFGPRIRALRLAQKMRVTTMLAKLEILGWSLAPSAWTLIERGDRTLTDYEIVMILRVLRLKLRDLEENA